MKIKGVLTFSSGKTSSPVDRWRIEHPLKELKKQTDWEVDLSLQFLEGSGKTVTNEDMENTLEKMKDIDILFSSYYFNPVQFSFLKIAAERTNTKLVMDIDDDLYNIASTNPFWFAAGQRYIEHLERVNPQLAIDEAERLDKLPVDERNREVMKFIHTMVEEVPYITTTNEILAETFRSKRRQSPDTVIVLPNLINTDKHKGHKFDNGDKVVIGYFGGASHYKDLNHTNFSLALQKVMRKHKNTEFILVGGKKREEGVGELKNTTINVSLPPKRTTYNKGARGDEWYDLYNTLEIDIACGPLVDDRFNASKSNIKWQESSILGAAFIASAVAPYSNTIKHKKDGYLVNNTVESWEKGLDELITDKKLRKSLATNAKRRVMKEYALKNNWNNYKEAFQWIKDH